jgi:hypothetical protein
MSGVAVTKNQQLKSLNESSYVNKKRTSSTEKSRLSENNKALKYCIDLVITKTFYP